MTLVTALVKRHAVAWRRQPAAEGTCADGEGVEQAAYHRSRIQRRLVGAEAANAANAANWHSVELPIGSVTAS
jgi:hypothetical protein